MCIISKMNIVLCYLRQTTALIHLYTVGLFRPVASMSCYVRFLGPLQLLAASCEASADDSFLSCRITAIRLIQRQLSKTERCFFFICFFCGWNMRQTATTRLSSDVWSSWNQSLLWSRKIIQTSNIQEKKDMFMNFEQFPIDRRTDGLRNNNSVGTSILSASFLSCPHLSVQTYPRCYLLYPAVAAAFVVRLSHLWTLMSCSHDS